MFVVQHRTQSSSLASVTALADRFDVTSETVRRDLAVLERSGSVQRVHGGAVKAGTVEVVNELERLIAVGVEVGDVADEYFQPQRRDEQQRNNGFQPLAAKAAQPGGDETGPAVQRCDGHETERIEADGQPGAVVGKDREQPGGQP